MTSARRIASYPNFCSREIGKGGREIRAGVARLAQACFPEKFEQDKGNFQMNHVDQPRLCAACLAGAHTIAAMSPPEHRVLKLCDCAGENACVVAVGAMHQGRICHWHVEGPMTMEQAAQVVGSIVAQFERAGCGIHSPRTQ
jgi:hypothetical protein